MRFYDYTFGLCIPPQHGVEEAERGLCQQGGGEGAQAPRQVAQLLQGAYLCARSKGRLDKFFRHIKHVLF
jgi:hypothetical protein